MCWVDLVTGETGGRGDRRRRGDGVVAARASRAPRRCVVDRDGLDLRIVDDDRHALTRRVDRARRSRRPARRRRSSCPPGTSRSTSSSRGATSVFNFTSKHQARPATGELVVGDRAWAIGGTDGPTRGACSTSAAGGGPREITWNWGGGAGRVGDHVVGLQFGAKWTEGTGFTENGADRRRPAHQDRPRADVGLRLGRPDAAVARRRSRRAARRRCCTPRFDKHSQGRRERRARERDPPGVRHVVGPARAPTTASSSSSTDSRASPRRPASAGEVTEPLPAFPCAVAPRMDRRWLTAVKFADGIVMRRLPVRAGVLLMLVAGLLGSLPEPARAIPGRLAASW